MIFFVFQEAALYSTYSTYNTNRTIVYIKQSFDDCFHWEFLSLLPRELHRNIAGSPAQTHANQGDKKWQN
jgi:hypothetical protein